VKAEKRSHWTRQSTGGTANVARIVKSYWVMTLLLMSEMLLLWLSVLNLWIFTTTNNFLNVAVGAWCMYVVVNGFQPLRHEIGYLRFLSVEQKLRVLEQRYSANPSFHNAYRYNVMLIRYMDMGSRLFPELESSKRWLKERSSHSSNRR
jgi:hypothetical protein